MNTKHDPCLIENPRADTLALMIHGITGSPHQFDPLVKSVYDQDCSIQSLLLPGHGGTAREFAQSGRAQWEAHVNRQVAGALLRYHKVVLIGHSMGCLLAVNAYCSLCDKSGVRGMILLAPPLHLHLTRECVWMNMKMALGKQIEEDEAKKNVRETCNSVAKGPAVGYVQWLPRYVDLLKMAGRTRKQLDQVHVPVLAVHSKLDEIVSEKSVLEIQEKLGASCRLVWLPESSHFYYEPEDAAQLNYEIGVFLQRDAR